MTKMQSDSNKENALNTLRPTVVDIDLDRLEENYRAIKESVGSALMMPILKANAYGHGLVPCAKALELQQPRYFGVAFLEEAVVLRQAGIKIPLLALGGISGRQIDMFLEHEVELTASSVTKLDAIEERARVKGKKARVHLKIDTGMERIGVHWYSAEALLKKTLELKCCEVVGIFSHFVNSEGEDLSLARLQLERFLECCEFFSKHSLPQPLRHIANSGAILQLPESHLDMVRPGLILYGVMPNNKLLNSIKVRPLLKLRSEVVYFKVIKQGAGVSYEHTWVSPRQTRIVTIPVGYGDGYSRRLSNCGRVLIRGNAYPIVGRICMDQFMVDIGPDGEAYNGDEVVLIGKQGEHEITVEEISRLIDTDPRDVLLSTNLRVPRLYHHREKVF